MEKQRTNPKGKIMSGEECRYFIRQYSFATLITSDLKISHIPFILSDDDVIETHLDSTNKQLKSLENELCLLSILGPHALISTTNYVIKPAVPTWNYASVSIKGRGSLMSDEQLVTSLDKMLDYFQPDLKNDNVTLPDEFRAKLMQGITGVQIEVIEIQGKLKLGQERKIEDQLRIFEMFSGSSLGDMLYAQFARQWLERFRPIILNSKLK